MENPEEIKSGFRYLQSRCNELHNYVTELESEVDSSSSIIKQLKKFAFKQMCSAEKKLLSNMFNISSESKYLRGNFHDHQFVYIDNLVLLDERLDEVEDVDVLKKMYTYLKQRFTELQKYSLIQESKIEDCKNLMDELFGKIEGENEEDAFPFVDSPEDRVGHSPEAEKRVVNSPEAEGRVVHFPEVEGRVVHSPKEKGQIIRSPEAERRVVHSPEAEGRVVHSPEAEGRVVHSPEVKDSPVSYHRRTPVDVEQRKVMSPEHVMRYTPLDEDDDSSFFENQRVSPELESPEDHEEYDYENEFDEEQMYYDNRSVIRKPQRAVMPEAVAPKGLPPIPTHVVSNKRIAPESKFKIFKEKVKSYNNIGSTGYGKSKPRRNEFNMATILPPVQSRVVKRQPIVVESQQSMHSEYELAIKRTSIKGIVKPSLLNKDIFRLRDPSVRVRGAPKQQDVHQELNKTPVLPSIFQQRDLIQTVSPQNQIRQSCVAPQNQAPQTLALPRIPQPPIQPKQSIQQTVSRIPRLPNIQQSQPKQGQIQSRIPQPPKGERTRHTANKFMQRRIARFQ
ncbi:uncharacterized protein [Clytia hemisphaerica]